MDKDKKLEQFFKNRVNDFDSTSDDWDLPDASVFENAQAHFPKHPKKEKRNRRVIFIFFAVGLLLSLLGYIFYLKKNVKNLKTELQIAQADIEKFNNKLTELEERHLEKIEEEKNKNLITSQVGENLIFDLFADASTPQPQPAGENILPPLAKLLNSGTTFSPAGGGWGVDASANKSKRNTSLEKTTFSKPQNNAKVLVFEKTKQEQKNTLLPSRFFQLSKIQKAQLTYPSIIHELIPLKRKRGNFEIGLSYTAVNYKIPFDYEFEKLESTKNDGKSFYLKTNGFKIDFAYNIHSNFWITSGVRKTGGTIGKWYSTKLIYDKEGEYIDNQGKTNNDFEINTKSGFGDTGSQITFEIPNGENIEDGDFLEAKWDYYQKFSFTQIPIGANYLFGKNKFQLLLKGGAGWNKVSFGEYFVEPLLEYEGKDLPINKNEKNENSKESSQFINGYAGLGLNYQLTRNWHARTSFTFEKNFIQSKKQLGSNSFSSLFDIGINYRF